MNWQPRLFLIGALVSVALGLAGCATVAPTPTQHYTNESTVEAVYPYQPSTAFDVVREALDGLPVVVRKASLEELVFSASSVEDTNMVLVVRLRPEGEDSTRVNARIVYRLFEREVFRHLAFDLATEVGTVSKARGLAAGTMIPHAVHPEGEADCTALEKSPANVLPNAGVRLTESPPEVVGGSESFSKRLKYPLQALDRRVEGVVYVRLVLDAGGEVDCAEVLAGLPGGLNEAALEAALESAYLPARRGGVPVPTSLLLPVMFRIR